MTTPLRRSRLSAQQWPYVRFSQPEGLWKVDARTKDGGSRKFFRTKAEAETFAQMCRVERENNGTSAFGNAELAKFGKTVQDAVNHFLIHLRQQARSISLDDAVRELISTKGSAGRTPDYCYHLGLRLGRFNREHPGRTVATFTAKELEAWLVGLNATAGTRNTFRRDLRTLFSFCEKRGYCATNEAAKTDRARDVDKPAEILSIAQAKALLEACDKITLPVVAISLFAGLRAAEVQKLDWGEVDFESGHIEVTAAKSKTAKRRLVPMSENLVQWIRPLACPHGRVAPTGLRKRLDAVKRSAGFGTPGTESKEEKKAGVKLKPWPQNSLRHSFGSYRLAQCHDSARVSLEMGNSPAMVFAHYRELVKPKDAAAFWQIRPNNDEKAGLKRVIAS